MADIKEMVLQISILSLIIGIVNAIKPYGKFDAQIRLFTACLMLLGVLAPILGSVSIKDIDSDFFMAAAPKENSQELMEKSDEEVLRLAEEELEDVLRLKLAEESVPCSSIIVSMNINENKSINISSVTVVSTKADEAEQTLRNVLGKEVEVIVKENF